MAVLSAPYKVDQKVLVDTGIRTGIKAGSGSGTVGGVGHEEGEAQGLLWDARIVEIRAGRCLCLRMFIQYQYYRQYHQLCSSLISVYFNTI